MKYTTLFVFLDALQIMLQNIYAKRVCAYRVYINMYIYICRVNDEIIFDKTINQIVSYLCILDNNSRIIIR